MASTTTAQSSGREAGRRPGDSEPILKVDGLVKHFAIRRGLLRRQVGAVRAVDGVSFTLSEGETLGLVGESGCGKSTLGRTVLGLLDATEGTVEFEGVDIVGLPRRKLRDVRRDMQMVFQDPYSSLDPRHTVHDIIAEPMRINGRYDSGRISELLDLVGLSPEHARRRPAQFSGGQRQRIGIARALALGPRVLILDEPVSALDVSIQAQVVNLLEDLQNELGLAYLFIAHDLSVVSHISDRVAVMYLGKIVETGPAEEIFTSPRHPYTQALLSAAPVPSPRGRGDRERIVIEGDVPNPASPPSGCRFRTRCFKVQPDCADAEPPLRIPAGGGHADACFYSEPWEQVRARRFRQAHDASD